MTAAGMPLPTTVKHFDSSPPIEIEDSTGLRETHGHHSSEVVKSAESLCACRRALYALAVGTRV